MRLKLTVAYTGTAYAGWQLQGEECGASTVQGELETALGVVAGQHIRVHGAGRTDAGVHAEGQVAHADVPWCRDIDWQRALNARLPRDIRIIEARPVPPDFHARFHAVGKLYAYSLYMNMASTPPRLDPFVWTTPPLDTARMEAAAVVVTGSHDFASFQNVGTPIADTTRALWSVRYVPGRVGPFICSEDWPAGTWFFHGNGFLKQMVRNLMGLLVWAGRGKMDAAGVAACLAARDRRAVPSPTAPARGLTLLRVDYPDMACPCE